MQTRPTSSVCQDTVCKHVILSNCYSMGSLYCVHDHSRELGFSVRYRVDSILKVGFACLLCSPLYLCQIIIVAKKVFSRATKKLPQADFYPGKQVYHEGNELFNDWSLLLSLSTKSRGAGDGLCAGVSMPLQNANSLRQSMCKHLVPCQPNRLSEIETQIWQIWVGLNVALSGAAEVPVGTSVPASGCYHLGPN